MRLIHDDQRKLHLPDHRQEVICSQPFRRHIQQLVSAGLQPPEHLALFRRRLGGIEERRRQSCLFQCGDLVLHQGNQRGNHQCHPGEQQSRQLIADRFACTSGHYTEGIPPRKQGIHHCFLAWPEGAVSKVLLEGRQFLHLLLLSQENRRKSSASPSVVFQNYFFSR